MKFKKKILLIVLAILISVSCTQQRVTNDDHVTLTIIHINDRHGRMDADPYISQMAKDLRSVGENVLIFDVGDALHGQITTNLTRGSSMVELMNAVGYNGMGIGNHEFVFGVDRMLELAEMMDFPFLAANVLLYGNGVFQSHTTTYVSGIKVGVFGVVTPETVTSSDPRLMVGLEFEDPMQTAVRMVSELKSEGCSFIIALAHLGGGETSLPKDRSDALAIPGVDLVIDGHSHTLLTNGRKVGNTWIVQAGEYAQNIGVVKINFSESNSENHIKAHTVEVRDSLPADASIVAKIDELNQSIEGVTSQIVGYTPFFLQGERDDVRTRDTNLSNLITDSMRFYNGADISFISGGSIRASIPEGDITLGHVLTTMPYSNLIVTVELQGTAIWEALERGVSVYPEPEGIFMQFSGLYVTFDPNAGPGNRIRSVRMQDDTLFDKQKTYTVAMIDFLLAGGDGYTMLTAGTNLVYYGGDAEAFVEYLATNPVIKEEGEGRISYQ